MESYFNINLHKTFSEICYNVAEDIIDYREDAGAYEGLRFTNNFIFAKVLQNNEDICKELIELLLDRKVRRIVKKEAEQTLQASPDSKAVRFDVYFEGDNDVYDLEMQTGRYSNLPKRARYYQGMIDLNLLAKGSDYGELRESYIIFICTFDLFQKGLHRYTFSRICEEIEDKNLKLNDGSKIVFICQGEGSDDKAPKLANFIKYLAGTVVDDPFINKLDAAVNNARKNKSWRLEYMTYEQEIEYFKKEAYKRGEAKGMAIGEAKGMAIGEAKGKTSTLAAVGLSKEQYEKILNGELKIKLEEN